MRAIFHQSDVLFKFKYILHDPIRSKNKETVATAMQRIQKKDYELLYKNNPAENKYIQKSIVWFFAKLPQDIQIRTIQLMMENHEKATQVFIATPFIYALNRYSKIRKENYEIKLELNSISLPEKFLRPLLRQYCRIIPAEPCCNCIVCSSSTTAIILGGSMAAWMFVGVSELPLCCKLMNIFTGMGAGGIIGFVGGCCCMIYAPQCTEFLEKKINYLT